MLYIANFNLKGGKLKAFQQWIKDHEKAYAEHAPKGWKYLGMYFYVCGFGPYHGAAL
jgi:hypothetical protein